MRKLDFAVIASHWLDTHRHNIILISINSECSYHATITIIILFPWRISICSQCDWRLGKYQEELEKERDGEQKTNKTNKEAGAAISPDLHKCKTWLICDIWLFSTSSFQKEKLTLLCIFWHQSMSNPMHSVVFRMWNVFFQKKIAIVRTYNCSNLMENVRHSFQEKNKICHSPTQAIVICGPRHKTLNIGTYLSHFLRIAQNAWLMNCLPMH